MVYCFRVRQQIESKLKLLLGRNNLINPRNAKYNSEGMVMLISEGNLPRDVLKNGVAVVTGAGRGIGFEAARALIWLGAKVAIAEIYERNGKASVDNLEKEFGNGSVMFVKTDVGNDKDVEKLADEVLKKWGKVDSVLNNATVFPIGPVKDTPVEKWDFSYRVNLRGPVLLARAFLPDMMEGKHGAFVCVSSSGAAAYMGAYEVFKTAQVELASTIAAEVEGTGVYAFTIGPGTVRTPGFIDGGGQVASYMHKTLDELLEMNKNFEISPEAAGVGFAASIALASKYHGQETSSIQVLREIGIVLGNQETDQSTNTKTASVTAPVSTSDPDELYKQILKTYTEQSEGWKKRGLFERQWIVRDFKKNTGLSIDEMLSALKNVGNNLKGQPASSSSAETLKKIAAYYEHQREQLKGFEKDPVKLQKNSAIIDGWISEISALLNALII
jgi:NAD(P)-dependent dehydrogenase (short-subunit alcohol dehydrogenase family)